MSSKNRRQPSSSSPGMAYLVMAIGGIAVLALVGWALSRSFSAPVNVPVTNTVATPPPQTATTATADEEAAKAAISRIGPEDLRQRMTGNQVTVIDVRDADSFINGHIPGSLHIPLARIEGEIPYLPKGKPIVTYCT